METAAELRARLGALAEAATQAPWDVSARDSGWGKTITDPQHVMTLGFELDGPPEPLLRGQFGMYADAALIVALVNAWPAIDGMLARVAAAEADAEAGWKWAWRFDQWFGDSATSELGDEERAEFQADLTCHENYGDPR